MRLLADENIPAELVRGLRREGLDVAWVMETSPSISDEDVVDMARAQSRVLLTQDKGDFGQLAFQQGLFPPEGVVLLRVTLDSPEKIVPRLASLLSLHGTWRGHFVVVSEDRIRYRLLGKIP